MMRRGIAMMVVGLTAWASAWAWAGEKAGMVVGRVVDVQGKPIGGAGVLALARYDVVGQVHADAEGRFRLGPIDPAKSLTIWASAPGMARERIEDVRVFAGADRDLGDFRLVPGTRLVGRAVDAHGGPVAGAKVSINVYHRVLGHTIDSNQKVWELATDAEGRFRVDDLPAGEASLTLKAPGKVFTFQGRPMVPGTAAVDLGDVKLDDETPIRGVVVDQAGKPAPKVLVYADYNYTDGATTDAEGRFAIGGSGQAAKEVRVQSNNYFAAKPFPIEGDREHLRLVVRKAFTILGSAVDAETGAPVPIDTVRLCMVEHEPDGTTSLRG